MRGNKVSRRAARYDSAGFGEAAGLRRNGGKQVSIGTWDRIASRLERVGADPDDSEETRLQKRLLLAVALMVAPAGLLWGTIYLLFDEPAAGAIPLFYGVVSYLSIAHFALTRRYRFFRFS